MNSMAWLYLILVWGYIAYCAFERREDYDSSQITKPEEHFEAASGSEIVEMNKDPSLVPLAKTTTDDSKKSPYNKCTRSKHWRRTRAEALKYYGEMCVLCGSKIGIEVHHRTYTRRGSELMQDLIVLCEKCHRRFHASSRTRNGLQKRSFF